jgi:hypothetical protein
MDLTDMSNLIPFPAPPAQPPSPAPILLADISALEVAILATLWNYHPRPLRVSEIYLAVRTSSGGMLEPCVAAVNHLALRGLISNSGPPFFHHQLNHDGIFTALYLAIAGVSHQFKVARLTGESISNDVNAQVPNSDLDMSKLSIFEHNVAGANREMMRSNLAVAHTSTHDLSIAGQTIATTSTDSATVPINARPTSTFEISITPPRILPDPLAHMPIVKPASEVEIEFCHTSCGRIAVAHCECGNPVCSAHRYDTDGKRDPAGTCSVCYDEIVAERIGMHQFGEV